MKLLSFATLALSLVYAQAYTLVISRDGAIYSKTLTAEAAYATIYDGATGLKVYTYGDSAGSVSFYGEETSTTSSTTTSSSSASSTTTSSSSSTITSSSTLSTSSSSIASSVLSMSSESSAASSSAFPYPTGCYSDEFKPNVKYSGSAFAAFTQLQYDSETALVGYFPESTDVADLTAVITADGYILLSNGLYMTVADDGAVSGTSSPSTDGFTIVSRLLYLDGANGWTFVEDGDAYPLYFTGAADYSQSGITYGSVIIDTYPDGSTYGSFDPSSDCASSSSSAAASSTSAFSFPTSSCQSDEFKPNVKYNGAGFAPFTQLQYDAETGLVGYFPESTEVANLTAIITADGYMLLSNGLYLTIADDGAVSGSSTATTDGFTIVSRLLYVDGSNGWTFVEDGDAYPLYFTSASDYSESGTTYGSVIIDTYPDGSTFGSFDPSTSCASSSSSAAASSTSAFSFPTSSCQSDELV
ncbi:unnamed protein product [Ambrosiozyma monospora]|uniref:Unnamed protein product n=1 Tax=Ambrosiozyma monospora TaxID=43982 RepID=A0ACB5T5Y0_AMBMO|nr:unnamed protein product [Ambrosiozyma monospora]